MTRLVLRLMPFVIVFGGSFLLTFLLTPLVREMNRRLGMVDRPDPRRINKVPIPRGGGIAIFLGLFVSYGLYIHFTGFPWMRVPTQVHPLRMILLSAAIFCLGLLDDKFNLNAKLKLLGQVAIAFFVWAWAGLGFHILWPTLPGAVDCLLTVFWIVGAVNAFNLIDGLDGLASGVAFIATIGMAGALIFAGLSEATLFHFALAGALFGFLFFNYNPASVFLGDSGSMLVGFLVSTLPLVCQTPNSFLVSVGVPFLAMGVPVFDTALAILRRLLRRLVFRCETAHAPTAGESDAVMTADHDHLHHRILRATGLNQRRAAWVLYAMTLVAVFAGLTGVVAASRSAGIWLLAVAIAAFVIFKDMASVELYDAGRLLAHLAHERGWGVRRRRSRWAIPLFVICDVMLLALAFFVSVWSLRIPVDSQLLRINLPVRLSVSFFLLVAMQTYVTAWGRASSANYLRLLIACAAGAVFSSVIIYYIPLTRTAHFIPGTLMYFAFAFIFIGVLRFFRPLVRDLFYLIACGRLKGETSVSRTLVYGAGLRYRAFRNELIRHTPENRRILIGLLDDDVLLRGKYVGSLKVLGTLLDAPDLIARHRIDTVVIACEVTEGWLAVIKKTLAPTGVKIIHFNFVEKEI